MRQSTEAAAATGSPTTSHQDRIRQASRPNNDLSLGHGRWQQGGLWLSVIQTLGVAETLGRQGAQCRAPLRKASQDARGLGQEGLGPRRILAGEPLQQTRAPIPWAMPSPPVVPPPRPGCRRPVPTPAANLHAPQSDCTAVHQEPRRPNAGPAPDQHGASVFQLSQGEDETRLSAGPAPQQLIHRPASLSPRRASQCRIRAHTCSVMTARPRRCQFIRGAKAHGFRGIDGHLLRLEDPMPSRLHQPRNDGHARRASALPV